MTRRILFGILGFGASAQYPDKTPTAPTGSSTAATGCRVQLFDTQELIVCQEYLTKDAQTVSSLLGRKPKNGECPACFARGMSTIRGAWLAGGTRGRVVIEEIFWLESLPSTAGSTNGRERAVCLSGW